MEWTDTDTKIKNLIYDCVAELGGLSDILSTISSWKETISDEEVLGGLNSWIDDSKSNHPSTNLVEQ